MIKKTFKGLFAFINKMSKMMLTILRPAKSLLLFMSLIMITAGLMYNGFGGGEELEWYEVMFTKGSASAFVYLYLSFFILNFYTIGFQKWNDKKLKKFEYEKNRGAIESQIKTNAYDKAYKDANKDNERNINNG